MNALYVVYDSRCGLCAHLKGWLGQQPAYLPIRLFPGGSAEVRALFPTLPEGELAVVADTGELWLGDRAWVICLWALRDYRGWALRLSSPNLLPLARQAYGMLARNRKALSNFLHLKGEAAVVSVLEAQPLPPCRYKAVS